MKANTVADSFYLPLPSNSNHPGNKASNYTVYLPASIELRGEWEVGLTEMIYPFTCPNLKENVELFVFAPRRADTPTRSDPQSTLYEYYKTIFPNTKADIFRVRISRGYYKTVQALLDGILRRIQKEWNSCKQTRQETEFPLPPFSYYPYTQRTSIWLPDKWAIHVEKVTELESLLGVSPTRSVEVDHNYANKVFLQVLKDNALTSLKMNWFYGSNISAMGQVPTLETRFPAFFVYSDIVKNRIVGDTYAPLLRMIPMTGECNSYTCKEYDKPYYVPISKSYINSVQIIITDDSGDEINVISGKVLTTLHFRRVQ